MNKNSKMSFRWIAIGFMLAWIAIGFNVPILVLPFAACIVMAWAYSLKRS